MSWWLEMAGRLLLALGLVAGSVRLVADGHGGWGAAALLAGVAVILPWRTL